MIATLARSDDPAVTVVRPEARLRPRFRSLLDPPALVHSYVRHGGLRAARVLLDRCDRYGEPTRRAVLDQLKRQWREPAKPNVWYSNPPPAYTDEERAFALALYERLARAHR